MVLILSAVLWSTAAIAQDAPSSIDITLSSGIACMTPLEVKESLQSATPGPGTIAQGCGMVDGTVDVTVTPVESYQDPNFSGEIVKFTAPDGSSMYGLMGSWPPADYIPADNGMNI